MITYELQCPDPEHDHFRPQYYHLRGTLGELIHQLIDINHRYGCQDLSYDYWPYLYWDDPQNNREYLFSPDEEPDYPVYTTAIVTRMAATVWGEDSQRVDLTPIAENI